MTDNFDRFSPPEEPMPVSECTFCGETLYVGDSVRKTNDGEYVCNSYVCVEEYAIAQTYCDQGTLNDRGEIE